MFTVYNAEFVVRTKGKGTYEVTDKVAELVRASQVQTGLVNEFLRHTSASLPIFENADLSVRRDLEKFFERLVPEGEGYFSHSMEGPDDMPSIFVRRSRGPRNRSRSRLANCGSALGRACFCTNTGRWVPSGRWLFR
jgi:thiamine phosphate synthase YjbQ (UPF0047 family)